MLKRFGSITRIIAALFLSLFMTSFAPALTAHAATSNTTTITAKALTDHECNASEWHFVITEVSSEANAPASISVNFANGNLENVLLDKYTGKTAHYTTMTNLDSTVASASAVIYSGWDGQFNLSHGPCGESDDTQEVSVTPPTESDVCGKYSDSYTIPSQTGVIYKVNGTVTSAGTYFPSMVNATSVTITAEAASNQYTLTGQTSWTFNFTDEACDTVSVEDSGECVNKHLSDGEFTVTVHNNNGMDVYYVVLINNGAHYDGAVVANGDWHTFTFSGYAAGTYDISVVKVTSNSGPLTIPSDFIEQMLANVPLTSYNFKDVYAGSVTLDECPCDEPETPPTDNDVCPDMTGIQTNPADCAVNPGQGGGTTPPTTPGQVLGEATSGGHILATNTNVPNLLPNTSGTPAASPWLTIVAAAIAFLAARAITRKKLLSDQI